MELSLVCKKLVTDTDVARLLADQDLSKVESLNLSSNDLAEDPIRTTAKFFLFFFTFSLFF